MQCSGIGTAINYPPSIQGVIRMFTDFGLLSRFDINYNTFCRWLLTVKKNYRNETVKYHNWYHAFNVCQTMYCMLKNTGWSAKFGQVIYRPMLLLQFLNRGPRPDSGNFRLSVSGCSLLVLATTWTTAGRRTPSRSKPRTHWPRCTRIQLWSGTT